jgi:hypothetical protein
MKITSIATLVNEFAIDDLKVLLFTLELWNPRAPSVYIYADSKSVPRIKEIKYAGSVVIKEDALNAYTGMNRRTMESLRDIRGKTVFAQFTEEKTTLMEWALSIEPGGVLFCDADICHLGPLPQIPDDVELALSPHMIRKSDTDRYGIYNAGFLWFKSPAIAVRWRELCATSRFFEQACLEELAVDYRLYQFPIQVNYGWWRLWQGSQSPSYSRQTGVFTAWARQLLASLSSLSKTAYQRSFHFSLFIHTGARNLTDPHMNLTCGSWHNLENSSRLRRQQVLLNFSRQHSKFEYQLLLKSSGNNEFTLSRNDKDDCKRPRVR